MRQPDYTHGAYTAEYVGRVSDTDARAPHTWEIYRHFAVDNVGRCSLVGRMYEGGAFPQPHASLTKLVWAGPWPKDCSDPRSPNYGICFDISPQPTRAECLAKFAAAADRLIAWRAAQKEQS